jgi:hypothetical protein
MTDRAQKYRQKADECLRAAESVPAGDVREHYLHLARQWEELAAGVETIDRSKSPNND